METFFKQLTNHAQKTEKVINLEYSILAISNAKNEVLEISISKPF